MSTLPLTAERPSIRTMAGIETKRLARHPMFLTGVVALHVVLALVLLVDDEPGERTSNLLSWPVLPAFFVGLTSLVAMARLTRSTEEADEALATAPGTEARRTVALCLAGLLPFAVGLLFVVEMLVVTAIWEPVPQEWWFGTAGDLEVLAMLLANAPVACLGGALLGVLTGRWLRFPGAAIVVVVVTLASSILPAATADGPHTMLRLLAPWVLWHSGTWPDGTQILYPGSAGFSLVYALCLCAAAALAAVWHDRSARSRQLAVGFAAVVVVGLACLALAITTGPQQERVSDPVPSRVES